MRKVERSKRKESLQKSILWEIYSWSFCNESLGAGKEHDCSLNISDKNAVRMLPGENVPVGLRKPPISYASLLVILRFLLLHSWPTTKYCTVIKIPYFLSNTYFWVNKCNPLAPTWAAGNFSEDFQMHGQPFSYNFLIPQLLKVAWNRVNAEEVTAALSHTSTFTWQKIFEPDVFY